MIRRLICLMLIPLPVAAESPIADMVCAPRAEIVLRLEKGKGALVAGSGLRDTETIVEVWSDPSGDWTLVQSYPNGQVCILAMGQVWESGALPPA
jgi:hypothetical protein